MKIETDGPTRPSTAILLPQHADGQIINQAADFCEALRKREAYGLGFIPAIAYDQAIRRGRLFIELENDEPCGFCLWAKRKKVIRIHQTAVVEDARRLKHATSIVTTVLNTREGKSAATLRLRVADDLPANHFWRSIGCEIIGTQPGGKTWNRTINLYQLKLKNRMAIANGLIDAHLAAERESLAHHPNI